MTFCLVRYEVGKFILDHGKGLNSPSTSLSDKDKLIDKLEELLTRNYLSCCDPAIPVHRIASGGARSVICKLRLMAHHPSQYADKGKSMPQAEHDMLFSVSAEMNELHVLGFSDKRLDGFRWHIDSSFQLDAFVFMMIESRYQPPRAPLTEKAWALVADIFKFRPELMEDERNQLYSSVRQLVLQAWAFRESEAGRQGFEAVTQPAFILRLREAPRVPPTSHHLAMPAPSQPTSLANLRETAAVLHDAVSASQNMDVETDDYQMTDGLDINWEAVDWESWDFWNDMLRAQAPQA